MSKIAVALRLSIRCSCVLIGMLIAGCMPISPEFTPAPSRATSTISELIVRDSSATLSIPTVTTPTVERRITPYPWMATALPEELKGLFDLERCERPCFHHIMLGQTLEEALVSIRNDPWVDTSHIYSDGDYVYIYTDDWLGLTTVEWYWKSNEQYPLSSRGFVTVQNNMVTAIIVDLNAAVPLEMMLEEFGEPTFVLTEYISPGEVTFGLYYPDLGFSYSPNNLGNPPSLNELNVVERIGISELGTDIEFVCMSSVYKGLGQAWKGLGGVDIYYDSEGNLIDTFPLNCPLS